MRLEAEVHGVAIRGQSLPGQPGPLAEARLGELDGPQLQDSCPAVRPDLQLVELEGPQGDLVAALVEAPDVPVPKAEAVPLVAAESDRHDVGQAAVGVDTAGQPDVGVEDLGEVTPAIGQVAGLALAAREERQPQNPSRRPPSKKSSRRGGDAAAVGVPDRRHEGWGRERRRAVSRGRPAGR